MDWWRYQITKSNDEDIQIMIDIEKRKTNPRATMFNNPTVSRGSLVLQLKTPLLSILLMQQMSTTYNILERISMNELQFLIYTADNDSETASVINKGKRFGLVKRNGEFFRCRCSCN